MSAGSSNSNLGYGHLTPNNNINNNYVNVGSTNNPANFSSIEIPGTNGLPGLSGAKSSVDAVSGNWIGGGANIKKKHKKNYKTIKRKIKKITSYYKKMNGGSNRRKNIKKTLKKRVLNRRINRQLAGKKYGFKKSNKIRKMKGGYSQFNSDIANTQGYGVGGLLPASQLGLANPPPIIPYTNCRDNYSHYN